MRPWIGYSLNVHPSETLDELLDSIERFVCPVRDAVLPGRPMGVELRLGAAGVRELAAGGAARLARVLEARELVPFAANGFPFSVFTRGQVKQAVYRPDWTEPERAELTLLLARALAEISPEQRISISTVAGMFRPRGSGEAVERRIADALRGVARELARLEEQTGKHVVLCLEPEPFTTLETTPETLRFFERWLDDEPARRHIGLNLDVCHQAVVFEQITESLAALVEAGITLGKLHVSAALALPRPDAATLERLARFDEPRYLHQTFVRRPYGAIDRFLDLDRFLAAPGEVEEARVHFHVPLAGESAEGLGTTRDQAAAAVAWLNERPGVCDHLVVETYTWDVLRERELVREGLVAGIAAELCWLIERMEP